MIHREGYPTILISIGLFMLLGAAIHVYAPEIVFKLSVLVFLVLFVIILQFFRNPVRNSVVSSSDILSPADGKVVVIEETTENEFFKDKRLQVSIFMSPFNVHVNRNPIGGVIEYARYHKGKYLVAWHPKSSTENERTTIVIRGEKAVVLFRQIAGALARRIVMYSKEGEKAVQGNEMGFIKFGSRVDLFLPVGTVLKVKIGDTVTGGESVIGSFI
jgi:phosphatidylserine decarboxylase